MYCHQCGAKVYGAYCSDCGTKQIVGEEHSKTVPRDWADIIQYDVILGRPEVRDLIGRYASQAKEITSGEDYLKLCDKALIPLTGISFAKFAKIAHPIYAAVGLKTSKKRKESFAEPAGRVLVATICSLARHGQQLNKAEQGQDSCLLKATIPSNMWSFAGDIVITVERQKEGTSVEAATVIKGQVFDWGKSKRLLNSLFEDISSLPVK